MRSPQLILLLSYVLTACSGGTGMGTQSPVPAAALTAADRAAATISAADVQRRVAFLASDALRGRDTPSPGLEEAARYAAEQFRSFGLQPAGDSGTFIRRFDYQRNDIDVTALRVAARAAGTTTMLRYARDYFVLPARIDSVVGTPLFLGQARAGMTLPADARGRIVVAFVPDTASSAWQQSLLPLLQASMMGGAAGVIFVLDPLFDEAKVGDISHQLPTALLPIPIVGVRHDVMAPLFRAANLDLAAVRTRTDGAPQPLTGVTFAIHTPASSAATRPPNIVAVLPGSDPQLRAEYIVFSAHIDHVGVGPADARGDSIYNGADDNASGTSAVLEIAEAFAALPEKPARSVMFVLVSGEEKGLLGSAAFVQNPPVPTSQMVANINIDMVGRNAPDTVVAIGQDYSSLGPTVQAVARRHGQLGLTVAPDLWPQEQLFFRSDHFNFAAKQVPAIFFTTGLHEQYHKPGDEAQLIDNDKVARIAQLLFRVAHELATTAVRPQWTAEGLAEMRRHTGRN
jgi:Zn-dependent M28 family amino/carboxypeptidase